MNFIPRCLFFRGFCEFQKEDEFGLKLDELQTRINPLLARLPAEYAAWVDDEAGIHAPRFRNRQATIYVKDDSPTDSCQLICRELNRLIKADGITVHGKQPYFGPDVSQARKCRNAALKRAEVDIAPRLKEGESLYLDWVAGKLLYRHANQDRCIATYNMQQERLVWHEQVLASLWPGAPVPDGR
jgi:hypothetical protein